MTLVMRREGDIEGLRERCKAALRAIDAERLARGQAERRAARLAHDAESLRAPRGSCPGPERVSWGARCVASPFMCGQVPATHFGCEA